MGLRDLARRAVTSTKREAPYLSFGSWDRLPDSSPRVIQVCHPAWRGIRSVTYAFGAPVIEADDLIAWGRELVDQIEQARTDCIVIQGWPPGSRSFVELLSKTGVRVQCILHSSPAQHGAESGEASVVDEVLDLARSGDLDRVGMVKSGVARAFGALGHEVWHVPNRAPVLPDVSPISPGEGFHVGVFAEPYWRKNITTQLLAVGLLDGAIAHVMARPPNGYLRPLEVVEHGELPWKDFISLQAGMDLNLYVTLSECHPATPQESYLSGVPCLVSRVSEVFKSDPRLWDLTSVDEADNPSSIAQAAAALLSNREEAIARATDWIKEADARAADIWDRFVSP